MGSPAIVARLLPHAVDRIHPAGSENPLHGLSQLQRTPDHGALGLHGRRSALRADLGRQPGAFAAESYRALSPSVLRGSRRARGDLQPGGFYPRYSVLFDLVSHSLEPEYDTALRPLFDLFPVLERGIPDSQFAGTRGGAGSQCRLAGRDSSVLCGLADIAKRARGSVASDDRPRIRAGRRAAADRT